MNHRSSILTSRGGRAVVFGGLALTMLAVAGCGGGSKSTVGSTAANSSSINSSAAPVQGDTLTIAAQAAPNSLDPGTINAATSTYTLLAYDSLIYRSADGSLQPDLAESWQYVGSNNTQLDIKLRSGVTFSNGTPVTADAVKASLDYAQKAAGAQSPLLAGLTFTVTGPLALSVKSATPNPEIAETFTQFNGVGQIISSAGIADPKSLTASAVSQGAGPYVLDPANTVVNDHYTYTARDGYFEPARQHFKKIVVRVIANPQAAVNAIKTKQVDVVIGGDPTVAAQVTSAGLKVSSIAFVFQGLSLIDRGGEVSKPLGDLRVRQAINSAIDRTIVAKAVLGEYGVPTTQTVVHGADGYSDTAASRYPYDPAKAKQLLADAGYGSGFTLPVAAVQFAGVDTMAQAIKGQLAQVGITVDLKTDTDINGYLQDLTGRKFPAAAIGYGAQSIFQEGQGLFLPSAPVFNGFKTDDKKLTDLYNQAAAADTATRANLDKQIEEYLVEQAWFAPVAFSPVVYFSRADLGGIQLSGAAPIATPLDWYDTK